MAGLSAGEGRRAQRLKRLVALSCLALGAARPAGAAPKMSFESVPGALPDQGCGVPEDASYGCYSSYLVIADVNGDAHLDVLFANGGGYYEPGNAEPARIHWGSGSRTLARANVEIGTSRLRQIAVGDIDGDADLDLYLPGGYGIDADKLLVNQGENFVDEAKARISTASRAGAARFGDFDGDGDLDLVVTDWGDQPLSSVSSLSLYLNDGEGGFSRDQGALPPARPAEFGTTPIDVDAVDLDGDFDLDIVVNNRNGRSRLLFNDGTGFFDEKSENFPEKRGPYTYNLDFCDIDADGDLDVVADNSASNVENHNSQILINDGDGMFSDETEERVASEPQADDNLVKCADVDGDGHYDLIVASLSNASEKLLLNDGTGHFEYLPGVFPEVLDPSLGLDVGDLDEDGQLDIVTAQGEQTPQVDRVYFGAGQARDVTPPILRSQRAEAQPGEALRVSVRDRYTSDAGNIVKSLWLELDAVALTNVPVRSVGGDLFEARLPTSLAHGSLRFVALDFAGNRGESDTIQLGHDEGLGSGGASDGGASPTDTDLDAGQAGEPTGGQAGAPATSADGGVGGAALERPSSRGSGDAGGCRLSPGPGRHGAVPLLSLGWLAIAMAWRRRVALFARNR